MKSNRRTAPKLRLAVFLLLLAGLAFSLVKPPGETLYEVRINKQAVALVEDPSDMEALSARIEEDLTALYYAPDLEPYYTVEYEKVPAEDRSPSGYDAVKERVLAVQKYTASGYDLLIEGEVYASAVADSTLRLVVDRVRAGMAAPYEDMENVVFRESVEISPSRIFLSDTLKASEVDPLVTHLLTGREDVETYIVQKGDTLSAVADSQGLSLDAILDANPDVDVDRIHPGQALFLTKPSPVLHRK